MGRTLTTEQAVTARSRPNYTNQDLYAFLRASGARALKEVRVTSPRQYSAITYRLRSHGGKFANTIERILLENGQKAAPAPYTPVKPLIAKQDLLLALQTLENQVAKIRAAIEEADHVA